MENISNYDAYIASGAVLMNKEVLDRAKPKVIASPSTGTDHIDVNYAENKNIQVIHIAKELDLLESFTATAEQAWALLCCVRKLPAAVECANGYWARKIYR